MKLEDYSKYYIQGSDHYLIPSEEFEELSYEVVKTKEQLKSYEALVNDYINKYDDLSIRIDKAIEYINSYDDGCYSDNTLKHKIAELNITELLKILKGEE